jgi:hypothetical protein
MAKKRMVSNQIVDSDDFLDMPLSAQALYFHLLVRADDEGFTNGIKKVMRMIGSRDDDLKVLIGKKFVIMFESGVLVIKHWLIHNTIRKDRLIETTHLEEKDQISIKRNNSYTLKTSKQKQIILDDVQVTDTCQADDRIDKIRLDKIRLDKNSKEKDKKKNSRFKKPTIKELEKYKKERNTLFDVNTFYDFYESKGWKVGKNSMKDWKAAFRTWERREKESQPKETPLMSDREKQVFGDEY